jgi:ABC-type uncharacterized transport system auxiliary subunit
MIRRAAFGARTKRWLASGIRRSVVFGLAVGAVLSLGCFGPPSPVDHFYRLAVDAPPRLAETPLAGRLEIERVRVEAIAQGRQIAHSAAGRPNEVGLYAYRNWVDPLPTMIQGALERALRQAGVATEVSVPGFRLEPDYALFGRVIAFERVVGVETSAGHVAIEFSLVRTADRELVLQQTYREEVDTATQTVAAAVDAMSAALSRVVASLVRDIAGENAGENAGHLAP